MYRTYWEFLISSTYDIIVKTILSYRIVIASMKLTIIVYRDNEYWAKSHTLIESPYSFVKYFTIFLKKKTE